MGYSWIYWKWIKTFWSVKIKKHQHSCIRYNFNNGELWFPRRPQSEDQNILIYILYIKSDSDFSLHISSSSCLCLTCAVFCILFVNCVITVQLQFGSYPLSFCSLNQIMKRSSVLQPGQFILTEKRLINVSNLCFLLLQLSSLNPM